MLLQAGYRPERNPQLQRLLEVALQEAGHQLDALAQLGLHGPVEGQQGHPAQGHHGGQHPRGHHQREAQPEMALPGGRPHFRPPAGDGGNDRQAA